MYCIFNLHLQNNQGFLATQQLKGLFLLLRPQFSMKLVVDKVGKMLCRGLLAVRGAVV